MRDRPEVLYRGEGGPVLKHLWSGRVKRQGIIQENTNCVILKIWFLFFKILLQCTDKRNVNNTLLTASKLKVRMAEKFQNHLRDAKFGHFKTLRRRFDESNPSEGPYIWYQNLGFSL